MTDPEDETPPDREPDEDGEDLRPGFASEEDTEETPAPILTGNLKIAHYDGVSAEEAEKVWNQETLCGSCLAAPMCKVSEHTPGPLIVVARCLAYLPMAG